MKNDMHWDVDPNLPDEVNDCIEIMLLVFSWPPNYRTEVRRTVSGWEPEQVEDVTAWGAKMYANASDNGNAVPEEPLHLFEMRQRCAALLGKEMPERRPAMDGE